MSAPVTQAEMANVLSEYLSSRLGRKLDFSVAHECENVIVLKSNKITTPENFGMFKHIIKSLEVECRFFIRKDKTYFGRVHYHYDHKTGGSNGCETEIKLQYFPIGKKVFEVD